MKSYQYEVTTKLQDTNEIPLYSNGEKVGYVKRVYSNFLKKFFDSSLDQKYFVRIESQLTGFEQAFCKKVQKKGKIFFTAAEEGKPAYNIGYIGWKSLIPDLIIDNKEVQVLLSLDREDWSTFKWKDDIVARWKATYNEEQQNFAVVLEVEEQCPIENPGLLISIAQATLFIGA